MRNALFLFFVCTSVIAISQKSTTKSPKIVSKINLGETIIIENHQVTFAKVLEDSRCPKGVTCIWAGRARVQLFVGLEEEDSLIKELIFGQVKQGESKDLTLFTSEGNSVMGYALEPYPSSGDSGSEKEYQLFLSIEKNEK